MIKLIEIPTQFESTSSMQHATVEAFKDQETRFFVAQSSELSTVTHVAKIISDHTCSRTTLLQIFCVSIDDGSTARRCSA